MPRPVLAALLMVVCGASVTLVQAASGNDKAADSAQAARHADWDQQRNAMLQARLDRAAERLEIKASQQAVWNDYVTAVKTLAQRSDTSRDAASDAATLARRRADMATDTAQKLTRVADATGKLQAVLTADQRETLNEITRAERGGAFGPTPAMWRERGDFGPGRGQGAAPGFGPTHSFSDGPGRDASRGPHRRADFDGNGATGNSAPTPAQ